MDPINYSPTLIALPFPQSPCLVADDTPQKVCFDTGSTAKVNIVSGGQVYTGASAPATPDNPTKPALFYPTGGGAMLQWDVAGQAWV